MNEIGLKSCPFCGGELEYSFLLGASKCKGCGVMIGFPKLTRHEDKIIATNTRKPMANIVEKLEEELLTSQSAHAEAVIGMCGVSASGYLGEISAYTKAINIVKQEINNGLE